MSAANWNLHPGVEVPNPTAPKKVEVAVVEVALREVRDGVEVPISLVPSNEMRADPEKSELLVPPDAIASGVPRVRAVMYEVPVVAVSVPTLRVGNVVEPFAESIMKESADETAVPPEA